MRGGQDGVYHALHGTRSLPFIDAQRIGEVTDLLRHDFCKFSSVPAKCGNAMLPRTDLHAQVPPLRSDCRSRLWAEIPHTKDRTRIPHAIRLKECQLLHRCKRPIRRSDESFNGNFRCEILDRHTCIYIVRECTAKILYAVTRKCQSRCHLMSAKLNECISARSKRLIDVKPCDTAAGSLVDIALPREYNARAIVFFNKTGRYDADHTRIPVLARNDNRRHIRRKVRKISLCLCKDPLF